MGDHTEAQVGDVDGMRLLLFIAVFLWYYDSTSVDECFLKSAAVTLYGNYIGQ